MQFLKEAKKVISYCYLKDYTAKRKKVEEEKVKLLQFM